jgi:non-heme chloroperoxidase
MQLPIGKENATPIELFCQDLGVGPPVVLVHGWPLGSMVWERQVGALLAAGFRVITFDRRGFGRSSQPSTGYDCDTFADDLRQVLEQLDLRDCSLVGYSMGAGEVVRYLGSYGPERVRRAVFIGGMLPALQRSQDNPAGFDAGVLQACVQGVTADRPAFLRRFLSRTYRRSAQHAPGISPEALLAHWQAAAANSPLGTIECVRTWATDFRDDLRRIDVPCLVLHGSEDQVLPPATTAELTVQQLADARLHLLPGAPHGLLWTHAEEVNAALVAFCKEGSG